jgi:O-antigen/teichoic acid export membrane protein
VVEGEHLTGRVGLPPDEELVDLAAAGGAVASETEVLDSPAAGGAAIRGGTLRLVGYAAGVLMALAAAPLLIRHLGVADFGRYTLVLSLVALVQGLTEGGLTAIGLREYSVLEKDKRDDMMRHLLGLRIVLTTSGVALAVGFALVAGYDSAVVLGTAVAGVGLLLLTLFNLLSVPLSAELRYGWIAVGEVARQAVATVLIIVLVVAGARLVPLLAVQIPGGVVALAIVLALVRKRVPLKPAVERSAWWALARQTLPYAVAVAVAALYFRITIVLMSLVSTDQATGYFATSYRIIEVLIGVPLLVISTLFPVLARAAQNDASRLRYAAQRTLDMMIMAGVWISLALGLGASFVIQVLGGAKFEPAVSTLQIQAATIACLFTTVTCSFLLLALRRHRAILLGSLVPLVFGVTLTLLLAPSHGADGAAVATICAELGFAVTLLALVRGSGPGRVPLSLRVLIPTGLAAATGLAVGLLALSYDRPIVAAAAATVSYFGVLFALGQVPPELREALQLGKWRGRAT